MAQLSGSEPISAANLADVLGSGAVGCLTALYKDDDASQMTVQLSQPATDFEMIVVFLRWTGQYQITLTMFPDSGVNPLWINGEYSGGVRLSGATTLISSNGGIQRVYGIRSGGGQLLADLLATLEGVA